MSKISELSDGGSLQSTDYLIAVRSGGNVKVQADGNLSLGTITADGLTIDGGNTLRLNATSTTDFFTIIQGGTQAVLTADSPDGAGNMLFRTAAAGVDIDRMQIASGGDISFYEDTGTTAKFFWDASAESLGIGTSSPAATLHLAANTPQLRIQEEGSGEANRLLIDVDTDGVSYTATFGSGGTAQHRFFTTSNERMRIDSSGNVITGSTTANATDAVTLRQDGTVFANNLSVANASGSVGGTSPSLYSPASATLAISTGSTERMRIDSSGNVGIGTSSPNAPLTVNNGTDNSTVAVFHAGGGTPDRGLKVSTFSSTNNNAGVLLDAQTTVGGAALAFGTAGSEAMRISSTGSVLVGHTSANFASVGHGLQYTGNAYHTRDGGNPLTVNRKTSDGTIIDIMKDTASVGSIESYAGVVTGINLYPAGNVGIRGATAEIVPFGNGSDRDDAIGLGTASTRFKDLFLSDGVYLGGTGAANKLDDYEEGTFTPADNNLGDYTNSYGRYTKIGNLVHCFGYFTVQSNSNANPADLTMPFTYGFSAQTATIGTVLTNEAGNYYLKSTSSTLLTIVDEDEVAQTLADFSTKTVHFNVTFHVA